MGAKRTKRTDTSDQQLVSFFRLANISILLSPPSSSITPYLSHSGHLLLTQADKDEDTVPQFDQFLTEPFLNI